MEKLELMEAESQGRKAELISMEMCQRRAKSRPKQSRPDKHPESLWRNKTETAAETWGAWN